MTVLETSFGVYAACVREGRCDPPDGSLTHDPAGSGAWDDASRVHQPAAVSYFKARAFCLAYGGDLPTYAQWIRATEGDLGMFGVKPLTEAFLDCSFGRPSTLCDAVNDAGWTYRLHDPRLSNDNVYRALPDVGTNTWDIGPYGHHDLFGGAAEWVRLPSSGNPVRCSPTDLDADDFYVPYRDPLPTDRVPLVDIARDLWSQDDLLLAEPASNAVHMVHGQGTSEPAGSGQFYTGFRCAFPP
jgi:formylglycine-generating enzyme required for sulfatase activity